jgi:hypothetical protein
MFKTQKNKTAKGNGNLGQAQKWGGGDRGRDRMVVGFTTTCAISAYHH